MNTTVDEAAASARPPAEPEAPAGEPCRRWLPARHRRTIVTVGLVVYTVALAVLVLDDVFFRRLFPTKLEARARRLIERFDHPDEAKRRKAVEDLLHAGDELDVDALVRVARRVARAVEEQGNDGDARELAALIAPVATLHSAARKVVFAATAEEPDPDALPRLRRTRRELVGAVEKLSRAVSERMSAVPELRHAGDYAADVVELRPCADRGDIREPRLRAEPFVAIPELLRALDHESACRRALAAYCLFWLTTTSHGYDPHAPPEERRAAAARWRRWWAENRAHY